MDYGIAHHIPLISQFLEMNSLFIVHEVFSHLIYVMNFPYYDSKLTKNIFDNNIGFLYSWYWERIG